MMIGNEIVPDWPNNAKVFIIGGGPSTTVTPFISRLFFPIPEHWKIIAVNTSFKLFPKADILYFGDWEWADDNHDAIMRTWRGNEIITRALPQKRQWQFDYTRVGRDMMNGISISQGAVAGWDSGANAINVAYLKTCAEINLIGFDMKGNNWHSEHKRPKKPNCYQQDFIPYLTKMARALSNYSVKVYNCSPDSVLDCFEKRPLVEAFADV